MEITAGDVRGESDSDIDDFDARIPRSDDTTPAEFGNADGENSTQMSTPNAPDTQDESGTPQDTPADTPESDPVEQSLDPPELR